MGGFVGVIGVVRFLFRVMKTQTLGTFEPKYAPYFSSPGDFACLYGSSGEDDVQDEGFSAQARASIRLSSRPQEPPHPEILEVAEAKQKLEAADALRSDHRSPTRIAASHCGLPEEKLRQKQQSRQEAEVWSCPELEPMTLKRGP